MNPDRIDGLVAGLAFIRDDALLVEARSPRASRLLETILEQPPQRPASGRRRALVVGLAAVSLAAALAVGALGGAGRIRSWLSGGHGPDFPVPTATDVVIASGVAGTPWSIVATPSDQGLCLFLVTKEHGARAGAGSCGYLDIRGELPRDIRGDPSSRCLATPTTVVPCGSLPRHWIDAVSGSDTPDPHLTRTIAFDPVARGVARVDLVLDDGRVEGARLLQPPHLPLGFYWTELPLREVVTMAIARDARGDVLERRVPPWNGNPTGDPEGSRAPPARRAAAGKRDPLAGRARQGVGAPRSSDRA